jgi:hypothetical protein
MRRLLITAATVLGIAVASPSANAVGCFTGAVAGAVAGHMAHHGVLGAIGGCIAGHEWHKHQVKQKDLQNREAYVQERQKQDPNYKDPWAQDAQASHASQDDSAPHASQ